jgi:hypothetical protein
MALRRDNTQLDFHSIFLSKDNAIKRVISQ